MEVQHIMKLAAYVSHETCRVDAEKARLWGLKPEDARQTYQLLRFMSVPIEVMRRLQDKILKARTPEDKSKAAAAVSEAQCLNVTYLIMNGKAVEVARNTQGDSRFDTFLRLVNKRLYGNGRIAMKTLAQKAGIKYPPQQEPAPGGVEEIADIIG